MNHNIRLAYPLAFGVKTGYDDAIFPAEVCTIIPGQRYQRELSPNDTSEWIRMTNSNPSQRIRAITQAVKGTVSQLLH